MRRFLLFFAALSVVLTIAQAAVAAGPFANWAVIIVAGDWRAHGGGASEAFDNARRDLAKAFITDGFSADDISQFSARSFAIGAKAKPPSQNHAKSDRSADSALFVSAPDLIASELDRLTRKAPDGCLIYFTSHGSPGGVVVGDQILPPGVMGAMVDQSCKDRPTVVIISACYSGVFVPALNGPDRMVLTAARPDRTSFGCGQSDHYTYFDGCMLDGLTHAHDFVGLAETTRACVAQKEVQTGASPPSEPQLDIGAQLRLILPLYAFAAPPPR